MLLKINFAPVLLLIVLLGSAIAQRAQPSNDVLMGEWESRLASVESLFEEQIQLFRVKNEQLKAEVEQLKFEEAIRQTESQNLNQQVDKFLLPAATAIEGKAAPRNCAGLTQIGHRLSGLYLVQAASSQVQTVYCEINQVTGVVVNETILGYNDIKSSPVYFHVQRNAVYSTVKTTIPYNVQRLNTGNAFNLNTGIFSAPKAGRYFFTLSGISQTASTRVYLYVKSGVTQTDIASSFSIDKLDTYALQSTLDLKAGDEVTSYLGEGSVGDGGYANMHFTGLLLEQDLVLI